jgi:AcrR family transcriptional regulator
MPANLGTARGPLYRHPVEDLPSIWLRPVETEPSGSETDFGAMARPRAQLETHALADAFAPDGLHGTSSRALAAATGMAKPTLYEHGGSKEALFLRAVEAEVERVLDRLHAAESPTAIVHALLDHAAARPLGARLLTHTARHATSAVAAAVEATLNRIPGQIEVRLLRSGVDPAQAPFVARALYGAACALGEPRPGERRPARATLARLVAALVPEPAP